MTAKSIAAHNSESLLRIGGPFVLELSVTGKPSGVPLRCVHSAVFRDGGLQSFSLAQAKGSGCSIEVFICPHQRQYASTVTVGRTRRPGEDQGRDKAAAGEFINRAPIAGATEI